MSRYCTYVQVYSLVEAEDGPSAVATLRTALEVHGFVPYDSSAEPDAAFLSEHQDADADIGGELVRYHSILRADRSTCGVFRSAEAARAWARRHPDRVEGHFTVTSYVAPEPDGYTEDMS